MTILPFSPSKAYVGLSAEDRKAGAGPGTSHRGSAQARMPLQEKSLQKEVLRMLPGMISDLQTMASPSKPATLYLGMVNLYAWRTFQASKWVQAGVNCGVHCKCEDCHNTPEDGLPPPPRLPKAGTASAPQAAPSGQAAPMAPPSKTSPGTPPAT